MNVKHVIGLAAIVLGGMTSCSNILEEDRVANTITKGETGELRINLVADGSLNVTTKGTTTISTTGINTNEFDVKATSSNFVLEGKKVKDFPQTVLAATYTVEAKFDQMNNAVLKWNAASFSGKAESVEVRNADKGEAIISASLSNSVITFDNETTTTNFGTSATITEVFVYAGNKTYSTEDKFTLYKKEGDNEPVIETKKLFVAAEQPNVYIHIDGFVNDASHTRINHSRLISGYVENDEVINNNDKTYPCNEYKVAYQLVTEKGQLALQISLNELIDSVPLVFGIDPYPTE